MKDVFLRLLGSGMLIACVAALGAVAFQKAPQQEEVKSEEATETPEEKPRALSKPASIERSDVYYQAILDRPVFEISRRPIDPKVEVEEPVSEPEVVVVEQKPALELPQVSLLGVMSTGSRTQALISVEGAEPVWLSEGDKIGGWTITSAGADWLELAAEDNKVRLELFE